MEKKMTAEEIIDKNTFVKDGLITTENAIKCMKEYAKHFTPLPDNNGAKDGFEKWLEERVDYKTTVESAEIETMRMAYSSCLSEYRNFSPPAKVEVSDEQIALDFGCMANEWANNPNFSMKETVAKLRHLLSNK